MVWAGTITITADAAGLVAAVVVWAVAARLGRRAAVTYRERLLAQWPDRPDVREELAQVRTRGDWLPTLLIVLFFAGTTWIELTVWFQLGTCVLVAVWWTFMRVGQHEERWRRYARERALPVPTPMVGLHAAYVAAVVLAYAGWLAACCFVGRLLFDLL